MKDRTQVDPFIPTQEVWIIDSDPVEVDKIKSGISPKVISLNTFNDIVSALSGRLNGNINSFGTIIFSRNLPTDVKTNLEAVVTSLNNKTVNERLFIYHIADDNSSPFINSKICNTVDEFIDLANNVHVENIEENDSIDEEARKIIKKYRQSIAKKDNDINAKKNENKKLKNRIKELTEKLDIIHKQINRFEEENKHYEGIAKDAESKLNEIQNRLDVTGKELDNTRFELDKERTKNINGQAKIKGLEKAVDEANAKNNELYQQNRDLQDEIDHERERSQEYLEARTDSEQLSQLQDDLKSTLMLYKKTKSDISDLKAQLTVKENDIASKQNEIDQLRNSNQGLSNFGIPDPETFPVIKLKRTDLIYFKVIDQLPYHRFYINLFAKELRKIIDNKNVQIVNMMMKIDSGKDQDRFKDRIFIGNLDAVSNDDDKYYLFPTMNMDKNTFDFEDKERILIFIDYFDNSKKYVKTEGITDNYIVINRSRDARKIYDLEGKFISNDHSSLVDIKYDSTISTNTRENQMRRFQDTVRKLLLESNVVQKYI